MFQLLTLLRVGMFDWTSFDVDEVVRPGIFVVVSVESIDEVAVATAAVVVSSWASTPETRTIANRSNECLEKNRGALILAFNVKCAEDELKLQLAGDRVKRLAVWAESAMEKMCSGVRPCAS